LNCEDAGKGCLRDEKFKLAVKKAQEKGLIPKNVINFSNQATKSQDIKEQQTEEILRQLQERFIFKTPTDLEDLYFYEDGIYKEAKHRIKSILETQLSAKATSYFVNEIIEHLKRASYTDRSEFNNFAKHNCIPLQNGLFNLSTMQYEPFDPEKIFTYKLNVSYNPNAQCPNWLKFLDQILPKEDHALLQEWLGYCILPAMPKHKIMWFYGTGRNGKGRVIATLEHIIGKQNCSYLELKEFDGEHRFAIAQLYGKLINVSSEPSTIKDLQTPLLKKITGEDTLDAEVKNKQNRLSFKNVAKPFVLGNVFPKVKDTSVGFWERVKIIRFPYEFTGKNQKDNIEDTWLSNPEEVSGIFNWMLTGLHRLLLQGDFTDSKNTQETITEFKKASDTIGAWIDTCCIFDQDNYETNQALYEDYKLYCDDIAMTPETDKRFYQRLREIPRVKAHKKRSSRGFIGLKLKPQSVADVAHVAPFYNSFREPPNPPLSHKKLQTPATSATSATLSNDKKGIEPKTCGDCGRFHTDGCYHPALANGGDPALLKPDCSWACECRGFIEKQPELPSYPEEPITA
jgi:putative DNA primase/helicase